MLCKLNFTEKGIIISKFSYIVRKKLLYKNAKYTIIDEPESETNPELKFRCVYVQDISKVEAQE
jgi:hypothetical protein